MYMMLFSGLVSKVWEHMSGHSVDGADEHGMDRRFGRDTTE